MTKYTYSEWIEHDGKGMPVDGETIVRVRLGNGWKEPATFEHWTAAAWHEPATSSNWTCHEYSPDDAIVAYQIATPIND